jgi:tripartite ATP-independent transporter DctP family solute receptor
LADQTIVIKSSDVHGEDYPTVEAVRFMGELLSNWTNERITIQIYPDGKLGSEKDTLEQTRQGYIEMTRVSLGPVGKYAQGLNVFNLPFVFRSIKHMYNVVDGEIGTALLLELEQAGLIGLCFMDSGARSFYNSKRPISSPEDMKGLKFRVMNNPIFIEMIQAFGAKAVSIPFSETYKAIQSGAVDGAENNPPTVFTQKHYEVTKYFSITEHLIVPEILVFSKVAWDHLPAVDKELIKKAAIECSIKERELWQKKKLIDLKNLKEQGFTILDDIDKEPFIAATRAIREKYGAEFKGIMNKIEKTK